jgi:hypothetical protein
MASRVPWLGAGASFVLGITGWASETPPDEASALFGTTELSVHIGSTGEMAGQAGLPSELFENIDPGPTSGERTAPVPEPKPGTPTDASPRARGPDASSLADFPRQEEAAPRLRSAPAADGPDEQLAWLIAESGSEEWQAPTQLAETRARVLTEAEDEPAPPSAGAAPTVEVRIGSHGEYERVVFQWPEGVEYDVAQRAEQVTVVFSRAGRIDLSQLPVGPGERVVGVSAAGGEVTDKVVLRVVPEASIRTVSLDDDRIVAIDVYAEAAAQSTPSPAPQPERDAIQALMEALEQRDEVIENLLVRVEQLERRLTLSSDDLDQVVAGGAGAGALGSAPPAPAAAQPPIAAPDVAPEPPAATAQQAPRAGASQGGEPASNAQGAPGEFDVAEEDIDRALERTLVQTGALLLPFGQAEVEPYFSYTRQEDNVPALFFDGGGLGVSEREASTEGRGRRDLDRTADCFSAERICWIRKC